ncbi:putative aldehyde dehydrogenase [Pseudomonas aeruginosa]|nr:putative aldehyde dehydrogenase [Pseudomonas aeruginosa]
MVGQIIPWNFPLLMAAWKLARRWPPATAWCSSRPSRPAGICVLLELIGDLLPPACSTSSRASAGRPARPWPPASASPRSPSPVPPGRLAHPQVRGGEHHSSTVELGARARTSISKTSCRPSRRSSRRPPRPGAGLLQPGEVCTCRPRAGPGVDLPAFMEEVLKKVRAIKRGDPLDTETMVGARLPAAVREDPLLPRHRPAGRRRAARRRQRREARRQPGQRLLHPADPAQGHNGMRVFQEEIFGPVVGVTTFKDEAEALAIANDTEYGLGAGLWTRDINRAYRMGRGSRPVACGPTATTCTGPRRVRRLQEVRRRSRDAQDDARPLPADQEPAGELRHQPAGLLLSGPQPPRIAPTRGLSAKAPAGALVPRPDAAFPMAGSGATRPWPRLFFRLAAAPAWTRLLPCTRANQGGATAFSRRTLGGTGSPY